MYIYHVLCSFVCIENHASKVIIKGICMILLTDAWHLLKYAHCSVLKSVWEYIVVSSCLINQIFNRMRVPERIYPGWF